MTRHRPGVGRHREDDRSPPLGVIGTRTSTRVENSTRPDALEVDSISMRVAAVSMIASARRIGSVHACRP